MAFFVNSKNEFSETLMRTYLNTRAKLFGEFIKNGVDKNTIAKYVITKDSSIIKCNLPKQEHKTMLVYHYILVKKEFELQAWLRKNKPSTIRNEMINYYNQKLNTYSGVN